MPRPTRYPTIALTLATLGLTACSGPSTLPRQTVTPSTTASPAVPEAAQPVSSGLVDRSASLVEQVANHSAHLTRLPPDYLYARLLERDDDPAISDAFEQLRVGDMPAAHATLIRLLELDFIHNPETSSLDLLNTELSEHFRDFEWQENDYPGGPEGPNEQLADILSDALDLVSPERRANRTHTAVLLRDEMTQGLWEYTLDQWTPVPEEPDWKLNRYAAQAYVQMREAAQRDGVDLKILSGHRDPERARQNAEKAGNNFAVASFSSHSLGLAIDFELPRAGSGDRYQLTTRPMSEVVAMRCSPAHKWLHLHAHRFGWYPFQHEPWHWEFNPPGFREVFFTDYPDGPPSRE